MTPPPSATKVLLRSSLLCSALSHTFCKTSRLLYCSPSGSVTTWTSCLPPADRAFIHLQTECAHFCRAAAYDSVELGTKHTALSTREPLSHWSQQELFCPVRAAATSRSCPRALALCILGKICLLRIRLKSGGLQAPLQPHVLLRDAQGLGTASLCATGCVSRPDGGVGDVRAGDLAGKLADAIETTPNELSKGCLRNPK